MAFTANSQKNKKEKIRRRTKRSRFKQFYQQHRQLVTLGLYLVGFLIAFLVVVLLGRATLFANKYTIKKVTYDPESLAVYDDPMVYKAVSDTFSGKNYFMTKRFGKDELNAAVQEQFPLVSSVRFNQQTGSTVYARLEFYQPTLVFLVPSDRKIAVYAHDLYPLVSWNSLWSSSPVINLPRYTTWFDNLYGILFKIPETTLLQRVQTIQNTLGAEYINDMTYLPGWEKLFVTYKGKEVYFHLTKDINLQLAKLVDLEAYFNEFDSLERVDLGSVDDSIVR